MCRGRLPPGATPPPDADDDDPEPDVSRAYCLTCNEQVTETPSGTCPLGHPVTAHDQGPEPWVGFAGSGGAGQATPPPGTRLEAQPSVEMERLDADGRSVAHAGLGRTAQTTNGVANGAVHGTPLGGDHRAPGPDDLAALLAEALDDSDELHHSDHDSAPGAWTEAPTDEPPADPPAPIEDAPTDWGDLASLAAELQLDGDSRADDGPAAEAPAPDAPTVPAFDEAAIDSADIDQLLAELTGGTTHADAPGAPPAPAPDPAPRAAAPPPPPPAPPAPPAPAAPPPPAPAPAPDASLVDWDTLPTDDVPSAPPVADAADTWDAPAPADTSPAPPVDLTNFTARGRRVGESGALPARKKRGRKR